MCESPFETFQTSQHFNLAGDRILAGVSVVWLTLSMCVGFGADIGLWILQTPEYLVEGWFCTIVCLRAGFGHQSAT
jgi:hypothetical protein